MKDVGTIRVEIKHVRLGGEVPFEGYKVPESELVHERAKKAGAHCTKYVVTFLFSFLRYPLLLVFHRKFNLHVLLLDSIKQNGSTAQKR